MVLAVRGGYNATLSSHKTEYVVPSTGRYDKFKGKQTTYFSHTGCENICKKDDLHQLQPYQEMAVLSTQNVIGTNNDILHLHEKKSF